MELAKVALVTEDDGLLDICLLCFDPEPERLLAPNYRLNFDSLSDEDSRFNFRLDKGQLFVMPRICLQSGSQRRATNTKLPRPFALF